MTTTGNMLAKIINWANKEEPIRALILTGSRAGKGPVDDLSDFDVSVFSKTHEPYTQDDQWLSRLDKVWVYIPEKVDFGDAVYPSRLVIFKHGVKVDFIFYTVDVLAELVNRALPDWLNIGYQVLLDKDGMAARLARPTFDSVGAKRPTEQDLHNLVREFWFEAYHVAKYLHREELWLVKTREQGIKNGLLLKMIEWHERSRHDWKYDTRFGGKHMQAWVDGGVWESLHRTFSHFDSQDSWNALFATTTLFRQLATETADALGFAYPHEVDNHISQFIQYTSRLERNKDEKAR